MVNRFDNNAAFIDVEETTIRDLKATKFHRANEVSYSVDLGWASPPCVGFSNAYNSPKSRAQRRGESYSPNMDLVKTAIDSLTTIKPTFWVLENVVGSIRYIEPLLGKPRQIIGPFVLWGNFPLLSVPVDFKHSKVEGDTWSDDPLRPNKRAKIPIEISQALLDAMDNQTTLTNW
jgi:hypothetical protein